MPMSGARLKLTVADGNCPWWFTTSGAVPRTIVAIDESGTCVPPVPGT